MPQSSLWYQEAVINGVAMPPRRQDGDTSERRYQTFIEPFLQGHSGRLVELGCNAGFYLRKASELGYEAIGVENHPLYLSQARFWEKQEPVGVKVVEADLNDYRIPVAHTVLLANITYWLTPAQIADLVQRLKTRAMRVILVTRHKPLKPHKSDCRLDWLYTRFPGWERSKPIIGTKHLSVCLYNPKLKEIPIDKIRIGLYGVEAKRHLEKSFARLLRKVDDNALGVYKTLHYYRYLHSRRVKRVKRRKLIERKINMYHSVKQDGPLRPLHVYNRKGEYVLMDGDHLYVILKYLGFKTAICFVRRSRTWI